MNNVSINIWFCCNSLVDIDIDRDSCGARMVTCLTEKKGICNCIAIHNLSWLPRRQYWLILNFNYGKHTGKQKLCYFFRQDHNQTSNFMIFCVAAAVFIGGGCSVNFAQGYRYSLVNLGFELYPPAHFTDNSLKIFLLCCVGVLWYLIQHTESMILYSWFIKSWLDWLTVAALGFSHFVVVFVLAK